MWTARVLTLFPEMFPGPLGQSLAGKALTEAALEMRGASNAKAKRELAWRPAHPSWREGLAA